MTLAEEILAQEMRDIGQLPHINGCDWPSDQKVLERAAQVADKVCQLFPESKEGVAGAALVSLNILALKGE